LANSGAIDSNNKKELHEIYLPISNETKTITFEIEEHEPPLETLIRMAKSLNPRQMQLSNELNVSCAFDLPGLHKIKWWTKDGNKIVNVTTNQSSSSVTSNQQLEIPSSLSTTGSNRFASNKSNSVASNTASNSSVFNSMTKSNVNNSNSNSTSSINELNTGSSGKSKQNKTANYSSSNFYDNNNNSNTNNNFNKDSNNQNEPCFVCFK
jgi:hypothetical protein